MKNYIDIKREIPLFDDPKEAEIDEVFSSVAWDLPGRQNIPLDAFLPQKDEDVTVRILEYNVAGPWCSNFKFKRQFTNPDTKVMEVLYLQPDGSLAAREAEIKRSGGWLVGNQSDYRIRVNRATGNVLVINSQ